MPRVRQKDIAERLGVSTQCVSMALQGHRRISEAMREQVCATAREMGYAVDPAMTALSAYRTHSRMQGRKWERIALLHDWPTEQAWQENAYAQRIAMSVVEIAAQRGVTAEPIWVGNRSEHAEKVFRRLANAGVEGIIVLPHTNDVEPTTVPLPEGRFYVVTCGPEHLYDAYHTVQFDYFENFRLAWSKLRLRGCQRICLTYDDYHHWRTGNAWLAAYFLEMHLDGRNPMERPPIAVDHRKAGSKEALCKWLDDCRPDAVISSSYAATHWIGEHAPDVFVAEMNPHTPSQPGVDLNIPLFAECLVDNLMNEMHRALYSSDNPAFRIHIPGLWVEPGAAASDPGELRVAEPAKS